ncbi:MAG: formylglycine-generating enzyme family protein [bacterium]|nr:formylglycine-generating enzyme family protein [bacterium]
MGDNSFSEERCKHKVRIPPFYISKYTITQAQWGTVYDQVVTVDSDCPVYNVSYYGSLNFCRKISRTAGVWCTLPSEAEWEYACRAGTTSVYSFGDSVDCLANYAWYCDNSSQRTHSVGCKLPNAFGLYDMHGNVWEWVKDLWHESYSGAPTNGEAWETSTKYSRMRVVRGGSWYNDEGSLRSAYRECYRDDLEIDIIGFRVVVNIDEEKK